MTNKQFRLTIHHDEDSADLNPNEEDNLFKLHSFNRRHTNYTNPEVLLACRYEYPDGHENEGFACDELPMFHGEGEDDISDHEWEGPEGFFLSYFEHGSCKWGLAGTMSGMPDFHWDGVATAGFLEVVVPDSEREWWDGRPDEDREAAAKAFVDEYTDWANGEVYGYTLEKLNPKTCNLGYVHEDNEDLDSCWGFIGFEWFQTEVRWATYHMEATEDTTEIVDKAYGSADYGRWFVNEDEAREIDANMAKLRPNEGISV